MINVEEKIYKKRFTIWSIYKKKVHDMCSKGICAKTQCNCPPNGHIMVFSLLIDGPFIFNIDKKIDLLKQWKSHSLRADVETMILIKASYHARYVYNLFAWRLFIFQKLIMFRNSMIWIFRFLSRQV